VPRVDSSNGGYRQEQDRNYTTQVHRADYISTQPASQVCQIHRGGQNCLDWVGKSGNIWNSVADVAELADAQASGACGRKVVEVRLLSSAFFFFPQFAQIPQTGFL
jgi:hypothetical protein